MNVYKMIKFLYDINMHNMRHELIYMWYDVDDIRHDLRQMRYVCC